MKRRTLLGAGLALLLAACGGGGDAGRGITIGVQKGGVLFVAQQRGEVAKRLAAQGIAPVKWVEFPSGPPLIEAMRAGSVDLGAVGDTPVAYAQASGSDIVYVATHSFPSSITGGLIVPKGSPIRAAADLKGKRLAFTKGSASELSAVVALKKAGLTLRDLTPVYLAPGDAMTAFANGSIDAWLTWDPYRALAQERFGAREVPIDRAGLAATNFTIARGALVRERPQVVVATLDALRDEAAWARAHLPEVEKLASAATRLPPAVQHAMLARYGGNAFAIDPVSPADIANQQRVSDYLTQAGVLDRKLDAAAAAWTGWKPKS
ncbi:aliphatic sulfonate ABC transporter substrate-binding protein [Sphingomonas adhaesiva]|uniref:aliphatic sulfonate ABC transporter substrate-binding protein n=1 Tax=Sphingomonas adhaesiva TaxID=28212 RepID=UPI002FF5081A